MNGSITSSLQGKRGLVIGIASGLHAVLSRYTALENLAKTGIARATTG